MGSNKLYLVVEHCDDFEQVLAIRKKGEYPKGGILDWGQPAAIFKTRPEAVSAINRTEHYRLAFGDATMPEKKYCKVILAILEPGS